MFFSWEHSLFLPVLWFITQEITFQQTKIKLSTKEHNKTAQIYEIDDNSETKTDGNELLLHSRNQNLEKHKTEKDSRKQKCL